MRYDYCVYCHTTPSKRRYVGISCNPEKRWRNGRGYEKNYLFWRAITKYGWNNIDHAILFDNLTLDEAKKIEKKLISDWHLTDAQYGLNLSGGGDGILSDSSRIMMSEARKGNTNCNGRLLSVETKSKISESLRAYYSSHDAPFKGRHHSAKTIKKLKNRVVSDETKEKMRANHYDMTGTNNPSAKQVAQYSLDGHFIKEYSYATLASIENGIDLSAIIKCCRKKVKSAGGFKWAYLSEV